MTLREWLTKNSIPQREAAERLGVHLTTFNRWLNGHLMPSLDALRRIRALTEGAVTADSFLDASPSEPRRRGRRR
jgi:transcriptional regulator with XRE-family HTH domain